MATIQQVPTKTRSARGVMSSRAFVDGFESVRKGKPFDYDYSGILDFQWNYERGRILATVYKGKLKDGRTVTNEAIYALADAWNSGVLF